MWEGRGQQWRFVSAAAAAAGHKYQSKRNKHIYLFAKFDFDIFFMKHTSSARRQAAHFDLIVFHAENQFRETILMEH